MPDMPIRIAPAISEDSWLHRGDAEFEEFKKGYSYARNQTLTIPALAKLTPEEAYYVWSSIQRGVERARTGR